MGGNGRHHLLGVWSPDPTLSIVAAVGLGVAAGTALVVDSGNTGGKPGRRTLADLVADGPSLDELSPGRRGVAFIGGGGLEPEVIFDLTTRLAGRWPSTVVTVANLDAPLPTAPFIPLVGGQLAPTFAIKNAVWQPVGTSVDAPGPGPVLPRLPPRLVRHMLDARLPRRSRWVDALEPIWEMPWE